MLRTTVVAFLLVLSCSVLAAQSQQPATGTYQWSAEFVSFDEAAKAVTLKSRVAYQEAVDELKRFKPGDRVLLQWSGSDTYAEAIRQVRPSTPKAEERFVMPVELVSAAPPSPYVTFRLRVPEAGAATLKMMKPGEWVTVTSPHIVSGKSEPVAAIRPYTVAVTTTSATR